MNRIILTVFFIFVADAFYGQETFIKTFGDDYYDFANDMIINRDGHYVITGCISDSNTVANEILRHCCLMETDENGDIIWQKTYFEDYFSQGTSVEQLADGGYIVGCYKSEPETFKPGMCLIRTNAFGDTVWTKKYDTIENSVTVIVKQTSDNGFVIAGTKDDSSLSCGIICVIKTDEFGNKLWETTATPTEEYNETVSMLVTPDNEYLVMGLSYCMGYHCTFITKYSSEGDIIWTRIFGEYEVDSFGWKMIESNNSGFVILGTFFNYNTWERKLFLKNFDENGNEVWTKEFNIPTTSESGISIVNTTDEGFLIAYSGEDFYLIKTNNTGDVQWTNVAAYIHNIYIKSVLQTNDQGYVFAGKTNEMVSNHSISDILLIKTDMYGELGLEEVDNNNDAVYPNPNSGLFYIKPEETPEKIELFNSFGQCIYSCNSFEEGNLIRVDVQKAVSGIYYLRLTTPNGIKTGKVLINN